jgi:hypothetical protein
MSKSVQVIHSTSRIRLGISQRIVHQITIEQEIETEFCNHNTPQKELRIVPGIPSRSHWMKMKENKSCKTSTQGAET